MDELDAPNPGRRRRIGRNQRSRGRRGRRHDRAESTQRGRRGRRRDRAESKQLLTGHGRTVVSQQLVALHRELAETAWRCHEIETDQRLASDEELAELQRRAMQLGVEINQLESLLERADDPALEVGDSIGPGTVVGVVDAVNGTASEYRLVACDRETDSTVVTAGSVVGQALLGRRIGSLVTLNSPGGQLQRVRVVSARPIADRTVDQAAGDAR